MASPLLVFSVPTLVASPDRFSSGAAVMFSSKLLDPSAPPGGTNDRTLTLTLDAGNDLTFENGSKSVADARKIGSAATDVLLTHTITGTGGTSLGINVSQFDDTGKRLGQVLLKR